MFGWFSRKKNNAPETATDEGQGTIPASSQPDGPTQDSAAVVEITTAKQIEKPVDKAAEKAVSKAAEDLSFARRMRERLAKARHSLMDRVDSLFLGSKEIDAALLDDLEEVLITADIGMKTTQDLLDKARTLLKRDELKDPASLKKFLQDEIVDFLSQADQAKFAQPDSGPLVIMVLGVNGVGKTTTIGKMAHKFTLAGKKVLLVAADTFRAAASEQLKIWGDRVGVSVVAREEGADPSSVIYEALESPAGQAADIIIVDTAGRMHTKVNLIEELKKIKRVMAKKTEGAPHEVMLVLDATTGQNGISQARLFNEAVDVTGLVMTKLDGTAKGGIVINICREFNIPIRFIGIGEQMDDLRDFDPRAFVDALFGGEE